MFVFVRDALLRSSPAAAYRPFDSTDAHVVGGGVIEIELGPTSYVDDDGASLHVAPDRVVNVGVHSRLEFVLEGRGFVPLACDSPERRYRIVDTDLLAKGLVRRGSLQGESGPSVALEAGILLSTLHDEPGVGAEWIGIVSQIFAHLTAHLDGAVACTRADTWEPGLGSILEGPAWQSVRPVVEGTTSRELPEATHVDGPVGVIWEARDDLSLDLARRLAREGDRDVREIRAGQTWSCDCRKGGKQ